MVDRDTSNSRDQLRIDIIDVGQGDSILLEGPDGTTMLVDSGPRQDHGETVREHLDERDIDHLDHLVATHYDADHIGGHAEIIEAFGSDRIGAVHGPTMEGVTDPDSKTYKQYLQTIAETGLEINELQEGESFDLDEADVTVLNPSESIDTADRNENSVVLQATHEDHSILLAGDAEDEAETQMFEQYPDQLGAVDAVKAAHHGAHNGAGATSTSDINPSSVFLSSSLTNGYTREHDYNAHPHDTMLKHTHDHADDIDHYWTAVHGTTSAFVEADGIQIETARKQAALSAADVAAMRYHGRANDLDNEQLANVDEIQFSDLPDETSKWVCEANIVSMDQTLAEATAQSEETTKTPSNMSPQTDEELFQAVQAYADAQDQSVEEVLQSMQGQDTAVDHDAVVSETETAEPAEGDADADDATEETAEPGAQGEEIRAGIRSATVKDERGATTQKSNEKRSDDDSGIDF